jgi:L-alanine-DL-glutamate epimerase-like enolase superfamily enzyme
VRIVRVEAWSVALALTEPYTIAYETVSACTNVFLRLETSSGQVGYGVAAPDPGVTGEDAVRTEELLNGPVASLVQFEDAFLRHRILDRIKQAFPKNPSARAAVDMALLDLLGRVTGQPVWRLLGGYRPGMLTSYTISIYPPEETVRRSQEAVMRGFKALKLKGGSDVERDVEAVLRVRERVGPHVELRFDANQGYDADEARVLIERVAKADLELIEQPTPRGDLAMLGAATAAIPIPVMADESLMSLLDCFRLAKDDLVDMVNVKLMKVGGLEEAMLVDAVAQAAHLETMVGCMDECELSIAAGLHFALSRENVRYADLDGHFDLVGDPTAGCVTFEDGALWPVDRPGFGLDPRALE